MKQFIDNLISRLEEKIFSAELHDCGWEGQTAHNLLTLGDVRDAAEQLAEEYKGGWIPCSERLPEERDYYDGYVEPSDAVLVFTKYGDCKVSRYWGNRRNQRDYYDWVDIKYRTNDVLAWMPLPSPYQKEGE